MSTCCAAKKSRRKLETALTKPESDTAIKILVVDENPIRRAILEEGLKEAGYGNVVALATTTRLVDHIYRIDPDVILMDFENPSRDELDQMFQVSRIVRRPIAMFVDQSERGSISAAVDAGVSAYIVDGLKKERVSAILEMTILRFRAFDKLRSQLDEAKSALKDRKVIDRAKGFLMKSKGLDEEAAYALLRRTAMRQSRKISDVAESLLSAIDLLDKSGAEE
jgi:two-component system, response regulator / RNA-binding antiterminator